MPNRLASEPSPYLAQHADNPVDWHPWDDTALALAKAESKPILLSIGYSACHWCHVMAHESFEDEATAAVMNQHFVNIKVDREERPDLDKVYQLAHQLLTQAGGGWPLTMFLDPDTLIPFFGGTYFPNEPRYGLPGFTDVLLRLSQAFSEKRDDIREQGDKIGGVLTELQLTAREAELADEALLDAARERLGGTYDAQHHGFGNAPKFPMPSTVERLLRHWAYRGRRGERDREGLEMVMLTLTAMSRGGIYDHIGGGFCRYATDRHWQIPHFEKMLYDNGQLLSLYADALTIGPDPLFDATVRETVAWLEREMRHPQHGFYAALDADSEGEEGKFYVWRREQVKRLLTEDEYLLIETLYGLDKPANFENKWNFRRSDSWRSVIGRLSLEPGEADALLASARQKLFEARATRVAPGLDDKILTAWNGLTIGGLARAGAVLKEPAWIDTAQRAARFLHDSVWRDGQLFATWKDGSARYAGYLDDYAFLLAGLAALLQARWSDDMAGFAKALADAMLEQFQDDAEGGFFFTAHEHETLIHRPKPTNDDALPPGNGVAARALIELGHLFGEQRYLDAAARTLTWARAAMEQMPESHCSLLAGLEDLMVPPETVIIRGPAEEIEAWRAEAARGYKPWRQVYAIPYAPGANTPAYLPKLVSADQQARPVAFVCEGLSCSLPIDTLDGLQAALGD